jgi:hypothetical protein
VQSDCQQFLKLHCWLVAALVAGCIAGWLQAELLQLPKTEEARWVPQLIR